jgi:ketosteroid isomerase-like protein
MSEPDWTEQGIGWWEALGRGDMDAALTLAHPDLEIHIGPGFPFAVTEAHGAERFRELWVGMQDSFDSFELEPEELSDEGGGVGLATIRFHARGAGSGAEVSGRFYFVGLFRRGLLARGEMHLDRDEAVAATTRLRDGR